MNELVTIPREEYDRLRAAAEDLADAQSNDRTKAPSQHCAPLLILFRFVWMTLPIRPGPLRERVMRVIFRCRTPRARLRLISGA